MDNIPLEVPNYKCSYNNLYMTFVYMYGFYVLFFLLFLSTTTPPMANAATRATAARQPTVPPTMVPALEESTEWIKQ